MKRLWGSCVAAVVLILAISGWSAAAQTTGGATCYDPSDPNDLLLWPGQAPGAAGSDPCLDMPFLRVFKPAGPAPLTDIGIIVIPGGGYDRLSEPDEQSPVATYFANQLGATAFVLYYRLVQKSGVYRYPTPMWDGQRAVRYVRYNAARFGINPDHLGVFGFSAGGHLASTISIHFNSNFDVPSSDSVDQTDPRPSFLGLGYPVISMLPDEYAAMPSLRHLLFGYTGDDLSQLEEYLSGQKHVDSKTPPAFVFASSDDKLVNPQNSVLFYEALLAAKVPSEAHIFQKGKHGAGLATSEPYESIWPQLFEKWLQAQQLLPAPVSGSSRF